MKRFVLNVIQPTDSIPPPSDLEKIMSDVAQFVDELEKAGNLVLCARLLPATQSRVVRASGQNCFTTDGPFIESKEHVGGFTIIQVENKEAALEWAAKASRATTLPIEVRECQ